MEVLNAKSTAQTWPAGDLQPSRPTTVSEFFVAQFRVISGFRRFQRPRRAATTSRNSQFLPKPLDGSFFIPCGERVGTFL